VFPGRRYRQIAGHSAQFFQGANSRILSDLGDFVDDCAVDPNLHNDLALLFLVTVDAAGPIGSTVCR
jgi:hypothetical protein